MLFCPNCGGEVFAVGFLTFGLGLIGAIFLGAILFIVRIWWTYDTYNPTTKFNRLFQETGDEPWQRLVLL